jgi:hypothetical protein
MAKAGKNHRTIKRARKTEAAAPASQVGPEARVPQKHVIGPGEIQMHAETSLAVKSKQLDQHGRLLADQHKRWQADAVARILRECFPPDGVVPSHDKLSDADLILRVLGASAKPLPSPDTILRAAGRKPRK